MSQSPRGVVVISGATSGIGLACALDLCARGFTVVAGGRDPGAIAALERQAVTGLVPCRLDVTDDASIETALNRARSLSSDSGLAGLVNNAGVSLVGPLELQPLDALRAMLEVNVTGAVRLTQQALPALRRARGRVVFMGSIAGRSALPFLGGYSASKYAIEAIGDALRVEIAPWGLHVAIVEPGAIDTPINGKALESFDAVASTAAAQARYGRAMAAFRRQMTTTIGHALPPATVAAAVAHALTAKRPRTRYVVGRDARERVWLKRLLGDRLHDRAVRMVIGLPEHATDVAGADDP
ncbi:MAG: SDR family NAD(P)-dependent oxidoreductase [Vicinamibacterales bacterium]